MFFSRRASETDDGPWLVVGLGNPGPTYAGNRHNVGRFVVRELARRANVGWNRHKANAAIATIPATPTRPRVILAEPESFMNLSGGPTAQLARFFSIPPERVIVVHDELDLDFDRLRVKLGGGAGGHNGVKDIAARLGTQDFFRVRVGVGRPPGRMPAADFVLKDFSSTEKPTLEILVSDAADAVDLLIDHGLDETQRRVNAPR